MKSAYNQDGKLIDIAESIGKHTYTCPICKEELKRKFGAKNQYYAHKKGFGEDCELKIKMLEKKNDIEFSDDEVSILENEYYNKIFDNVNIELSDYESDEGYYLTKEQKNIIFSKEDRIKVSALAGAAKTSTLYYYCKERKDKRILYLVYNRSMKDEATKTFGNLPNVTIKTTHGLAYADVGVLYRSKLTFNYGVIDIIKDLNLNWGKDMELATKIHRLVTEYMLSNCKNFEDLKMYIDDEMHDSILANSKKLWELKKDYNNNVKVEHDFYLKLFQLKQLDMSKRYDIILVDEAQDSNMLVLDVLNNSNVKGVVIVGDTFQQLYGWRKATNIMPKFNGTEYKLTTSFRVSQQIANIANMIVEEITGEQIEMKGFNKNQTIVDKINKKQSYACLCRTNSYIFAEVFDAINKNRNVKVYFEGGYKSYKFENIQDAYNFYKGYRVNNNLFNKFSSYYSMIEYAKQVEDVEILALDRTIQKYGSDVLNIISKIRTNTVKNKLDADIIFSTIHRSKGMTYNIPVYISDDHFNIHDIYQKKHLIELGVKDRKDFNILDYYEEMCILYVAMTRCANQIELSNTMKNYLLTRHQYKNHNIGFDKNKY